MAEFKLDGRMKVKTLKENYKKNFGGTLRVYKSVTCKGAMADEDATLASLRAEGKKGGELTVGGNLRVGNFEKVANLQLVVTFALVTSRRRLPRCMASAFRLLQRTTANSLTTI